MKTLSIILDDDDELKNERQAVDFEAQALQTMESTQVHSYSHLHHFNDVAYIPCSEKGTKSHIRSGQQSIRWEEFFLWHYLEKFG